MSTLEVSVAKLANGLGEFYLTTRSMGDDPGGHVPVFCQVLDPAAFTVAFEPGSETYQALCNDQNRFAPPRSLPPILDLELPEDEDNPTDAYVITRYAYSEGAFRLLEDLLAEGHVFGMNDFLEFAWWLAKALAYLHGHGIVHGQWNARSVIAIPTEGGPHSFRESPSYRYEIINTGVCLEDPESFPKEFIERQYYPAEVFLTRETIPDYGALDLEGDVYCFAAFLKDVMQTGCSTEELPSQAARILEELQKEANRRGWKASPDARRQKEMEILDHLYTVKVRSEALIQEGLRARGERCTSGRLLQLAEDLHEKATSYLRQLLRWGFKRTNVFGEDLQHYMTYRLSVSPQRINSFEASEVVLTGTGLPHEFVRITLNERHDGVRLLSAQPGRIEFGISHGFPSGKYRVSINNSRTDGALEIFSPRWICLEPGEIHQPWDGFGNIRLSLRGEHLPEKVRYTVRPLDGDGADVDEGKEIAATTVAPPSDARRESTEGEDASNGPAEEVWLELPPDTPPASYGLFANGLRTGLGARVLSRLADPAVREGALQPAEIKNHRSWSLRLSGRDFHPSMVVDFGEHTPDGLHLSVESSSQARVELPGCFPAGEYRLRLNYRDTDVRLLVTEPRWDRAEPSLVKLARNEQNRPELVLSGTCLPALDVEGETYTLVGSGGEPIPESVLEAEDVDSESAHRLFLSPQLARGRRGIRFGQLDTGLHVRVRRALPRAAWVTASVVFVVAAFVAGSAILDRFAPRITGIEPNTVYDFATAAVDVDGEQLDAIELLSDDGTSVATFAADALEGQPGRYRFTPAGLPTGTYRLRPRGRFYAGSPTAHELTVRSPGFGIEPATVNRFEAEELRVRAAAGFDVGAIDTLQLLRSDGDGVFAELPVVGGRVGIRAGRFGATDEGQYVVNLDGQPVTRAAADGGSPVPLTLTVVGPHLTQVEPNPATLDSRGRVTVELKGTHLDDDLWFGLVAEGEAAEPDRYPLTSAGPTRSAELPAGVYRVWIGPDETAAEPVADLSVRVLPPPAISAVHPQELKPDRETTISFSGTNLAALDRIVLRPVDAALVGVEIPIDRQQLALSNDLEGSYDFGVTLRSGTYVVEPAANELRIEVFEDCEQLLHTFENDDDPELLLRCLEQGRPPADVVQRAADLFFDRGLFAQAHDLYREQGGLRSHYRASFVDAFVNGKAVPFRLSLDPDQRKTPYGIATVRLGWAGAGSAEFPEGVELPWELEYARGRTADDAEAAVAAYLRTIAGKTAASGGFEIHPFDRVRDDLAAARLDLAIDLIRRAEPLRARGLLEQDLIGDPDAWRRLPGEKQALARFWHGHMLLWYDGDEDAAAHEFRQAAQIDSAPAARWCQTYLDAIGDASRRPAKPGEATPGWPDSFLEVLGSYKEIIDDPNYDLLTESRGADVYLPAADRAKSVEFHEALQWLEQLPPEDPLAHYALLYIVRNAQKVSWPRQEGGEKALEHRRQLAALELPDALRPVQQYYLLLGELEPYDVAQIAVMSSAERADRTRRIETLEKTNLPAAFRETAADLKKKFLGPSVRRSTK